MSQFAYNESRYKMLVQSDEQRAELLMRQALGDFKSRWALYRQMAAMHYDGPMDDENGQDGKEEA